MSKYLSLFKIRFYQGLQYRTSALAGMVTQFVWGLLTIILFQLLHQTAMDSIELSTYVWLGQAFLSLSAIWYVDTSIFNSIEEGGVAYELMKPIDLYTMWFIKNLATRFSKALLRSIPMFMIVVFLPEPFSFKIPMNISIVAYFFLSLGLSTLIVTSINMIMYGITIFTKKSIGIRTLFASIFDLLDGNHIPYVFFPSFIQNIIQYTFFFGLQTTPIFIYLQRIDPISSIAFQVLWLIVLIVVGKLIFKCGLKHIEVYGG